MTGKVIRLNERGTTRSPGMLRVERSAGTVLLTAGDLVLTLTPAQAKQLGDYLVVQAVVLGEAPNG